MTIDYEDGTKCHGVQHLDIEMQVDLIMSLARVYARDYDTIDVDDSAEALQNAIRKALQSAQSTTQQASDAGRQG